MMFDRNYRRVSMRPSRVPCIYMPEDETRNSKSRKEKQVSRHPDDLRDERAIVLGNVLAGNPAQSIPSC
jgi:hypothetical protein